MTWNAGVNVRVVALWPFGDTQIYVDPAGRSGPGELARPECSVTTAASPHAIVPAEGRVRSRWR